MKKQTTKYYILLWMVVLFAAPGIAAYVFYQHPSWLGSTRVNKGTLLNPPVELNVLEGESKWRIIFWSPGACEKECLHQLDTLARVRLALGRKLYQVDQWLILGETAPPLSSKDKLLLKNMDFHLARLPAIDAKKSVFSRSKVFLADPGNYLVLSYSSSDHPDDVYKDLKLLLNTTENKSG